MIRRITLLALQRHILLIPDIHHAVHVYDVQIPVKNAYAILDAIQHGIQEMLIFPQRLFRLSPLHLLLNAV